ncbi:hypothetical protein DY000_02010853 [Brassica cretica]|uniref:Uncharacterized protein n=1 Tax=Brassica cretica TaxID=69181 RepID=A0ABQ7CP34_BRACR|nr:hypothetical protein DY000_02010853 [Brassica cretica]
MPPLTQRGSATVPNHLTNNPLHTLFTWYKILIPSSTAPANSISITPVKFKTASMDTIPENWTSKVPASPPPKFRRSTTPVPWIRKKGFAAPMLCQIAAASTIVYIFYHPRQWTPTSLPSKFGHFAGSLKANFSKRSGRWYFRVFWWSFKTSPSRKGSNKGPMIDLKPLDLDAHFVECRQHGDYVPASPPPKFRRSTTPVPWIRKKGFAAPMLCQIAAASTIVYIFYHPRQWTPTSLPSKFGHFAGSLNANFSKRSGRWYFAFSGGLSRQLDAHFVECRQHRDYGNQRHYILKTTSKKPSITKAVKWSSLPYPLIPFLMSFYAISNPVPPVCYILKIT